MGRFILITCLNVVIFVSKHNADVFYVHRVCPDPLVPQVKEVNPVIR